MSATKPIPLSREPSGYITDGRLTVGLIFDTADGVVATLNDRMPIGTFKDWKDARRAIHDARTEGGRTS